MTKVQLNRWKRLAFGFAKTLNITTERKNKLVLDIEDFFDFRIDSEYKKILDWDGDESEFYLCDEVDDFFSKYKHYHYRTDKEKGNKYFHQLSACIRAGFDIAVAPSAGVVGWFTKQNCVDIFKGRVPKWFSEGWRTPFNEIPNDKYLWL